MQYMLLIHDDEEQFARATEDERRGVFAAYEAFSRELRERDAMVGGNALQPSAVATTVRMRDGEISVTPGTLTSGSGQVSGYYLVDCADADEVHQLAGKIPAAAAGAIEVRPLMEVTAVTSHEAQR